MTVNDRKIFAMALVLVALMFLFVSVASAGSQDWYICTDLTLDKTAPGAGSYDLPTSPGNWKKWSAGPAQCDLTMEAGSWTMDLNYYAPCRGTLSVDVWNDEGWPSETARLAKKFGTTILSGSNTISVDIDDSLQSVDFDSGEHLVLWMGWYASDESSDLTLYCGSGKSTLTSPSTDPGYPVPEMSTMVLFSVGLLALVGYVVYRRRGI
jgi:hypothetical protein